MNTGEFTPQPFGIWRIQCVKHAERLAVDPATSQVVERLPASGQVGRFETEILTARKNLKSLMGLPGM